MEARALAVVLAALLAGCTAPTDAAPTPDEPDAPVALAGDDGFVVMRPERAAAPPLVLEMNATPQWLKPFGTLQASVAAPPEARVAWFVEHEDVDARASVVDGEVYVLKATTPDHHDTQGPRAPMAATQFEADGRPRTVRFTHQGRHTVEAENATLAVNIWPGAPADAPTQAFLVEEGGALRFDPPEVDVAPGARVVLWNQASRVVTLHQTGFAAYVPLAPHGGRVTPIDEGLYHLLALAVAPDGARGIARAPFLVDFERPAERLAVGPAVGRFLVAEAGAEPPSRVPFHATHPLETLVLHLNTTSLTPVPGSVRLELLAEGERVAEASSLTSTTIELADLPAGDYVAVVSGEHGAMVAFELTGEGRYRLPPAPRLA